MPAGQEPVPQAGQEPVSQAGPDNEPAAGAPSQPTGGDQQFRRELLGYVRQIARGGAQEEFNPAKLLGGIVQVLALLGLMMTLWNMLDDRTAAALVWGQVTMVGQLLALTLFVLARR